MNEAQKKAYASKYFRTGAEVRLAKEENSYPQMKYDSVRLLSTPDFGNLNTVSYWQYICAPLAMHPGLKKNDRDRYITFLGGDMRNTLNLEGTIEIVVGTSREDLQVFTFDKAVAAYIPSGMLYDIAVTQIRDAKNPILLNEFTFGPSVREALPGGTCDYDCFFKTGEDIWLKHHPYLEVIYPCAGFASDELGGTEPLHQSWIPVSDPSEMEIKSHSHDFDQFLCFTGTDPENMLDLGGEIEFTIGEEGKELITFSSTVACQFFVRKGLLHSSLVFKKVDNPQKPILLTETSFTDRYAHSEQIGELAEKYEYELFMEKLNTELQES